MSISIQNKIIRGLIISIMRAVAGFLILGSLNACSNISQPSQDINDDPKVSLKLQVRYHTSVPVFGTSALFFAKEIKQWTNTIRVKVHEPGELVPVKEILEAVSEGHIDAAWIPLSTLESKIDGIVLFDSLPFSPSANEHYRWLTMGDGGERLQKAIRDAGYYVKAIPAGMSGPEGFGWFSQPIQHPDDLKGLKLRYALFGEKILNRMGALSSDMPIDDVYHAFQKEVIDGFEYSTPYIDKGRKYHQIAKYYYYPSNLHPFHTIALLINQGTWNRMTSTQHKIIENVSQYTTNWSLNQDKLETDKALGFFKNSGVKVSAVPTKIVSAAKRAWQTYVEASGNKSSDFKAGYQSYLAFIEKRDPGYRAKRTDVQYDLVPIDKEYTANKYANIRKAPERGAPKVGQVAEGEKIFVHGRVKGQNWILVSRNGLKLGYVYDEMLESEETLRGFVEPGLASSQAAKIRSDLPAPGNFYALVIGIENYRRLPPLHTPIEDAIAVGSILENKYGFVVDKPLLLDATREAILHKFGEFREKMTETDNLLIYYAGHGTIDKSTGRGYWQPVDADSKNPANWISNEDVSNSLKAMSARHIIVIADSCYSGTITRSHGMHHYKDGGEREWMRRMMGRKSRTALTSGGTEPVVDSGGGQHSVFAKYLLQVLRGNERIIDMHRLYEPIREGIVWNALQTPKYEVIRLTGHDGGDFIFFPR